jgi:hypothetical protein
VLLALAVRCLIVHVPVTVLPPGREVADWEMSVASAGAVPVAKQVVATQGTSPVNGAGEVATGADAAATVASAAFGSTSRIVSVEKARVSNCEF